MIIASIYQADMINLPLNESNNYGLKYIKQKLTEPQRETGKSIITGYFNMTLNN